MSKYAIDAENDSISQWYERKRKEKEEAFEEHARLIRRRAPQEELDRAWADYQKKCEGFE